MNRGRAVRPLRADDLTRLRWAMEPAIDASGEWLAFVASGPDAELDRLDYRVHIVDLGTGDTRRVGASARTRRPRWGPSRLGLAVLADVDGHWQVALTDDAGGVASVASLPGDVATYDWSPDGMSIVCEVAKGAAGGGRGANRQVWVIDIGGGATHQVLPDASEESWGPAWSPDGRTIALFGGHGDDGSAVWLVDVAAPRAARCVATARGPLRALAWSPSGDAIAYVGRKTGAAPWCNDELWVVDPRDRRERRLGPSLDRSVGQVVRGDDERGTGTPCLSWNPAGTAVLAAFADGGTSSIASFDVSVPTPVAAWEHVVGGDRAVLEFDVAAASGAVAFTWSDPLIPGEVSVRLADGSERQCSDLARPVRDAFSLAPTGRITHVADDGETIEGWLTMPSESAGDVPLVLQVHGGPHYPVGHRFSYDAQRWAAAGVAVLRGNPRGSQGYGAEFAAGIHGDWGGRDFRDLLGLLDDAVDAGGVDRGRLAIVGESYGGYVVLWAIGHSDRFAAAVAENGISDLAAAARHNPGFWSAELAIVPGDVPDRVTERSPISAAAVVATPLLAVHAEHDTVSPSTQSAAMVAALRRHGATADLLEVPGEGHLVNLFGRPSRRVDKTRRIDEFVLGHLGVPVGAPASELADDTAVGATS